MPRFKMVCGHCGSTNVAVDAWAVWDFAKQAWVLGPMMDHQHCGIFLESSRVSGLRSHHTASM
jgi:hypothetical protein